MGCLQTLFHFNLRKDKATKKKNKNKGEKVPAADAQPLLDPNAGHLTESAGTQPAQAVFLAGQQDEATGQLPSCAREGLLGEPLAPEQTAGDAGPQAPPADPCLLHPHASHDNHTGNDKKKGCCKGCKGCDGSNCCSCNVLCCSCDCFRVLFDFFCLPFRLACIGCREICSCCRCRKPFFNTLEAAPAVNEVTVGVPVNTPAEIRVETTTVTVAQTENIPAVVPAALPETVPTGVPTLHGPTEVQPLLSTPPPIQRRPILS